MSADDCGFRLLRWRHSLLARANSGRPGPVAVHRRRGTGPGPGRTAGDGTPGTDRPAKDGLAQRVSHGSAHLPSSYRYYLTGKGISAASDALGFDAPSEFVRAYPVSRQWLTLLLRRMDAVASVYRLAATLSPGVDGIGTRVEFHRRGQFDAVITRHDGRSFGLVRQGLALRRRSLYDRLRAIAEYRPPTGPLSCWSSCPASGSSGSRTTSV